jgi:hypothetical protein
MVVTFCADVVVIALAPTVALMGVPSPAWLLGWKVDVAVATEAPDAVVVEAGDSESVKPECGYAAWVTAKVIGTPGWLVLSVAVTVKAALPATYVDDDATTLLTLVPLATV